MESGEECAFIRSLSKGLLPIKWSYNCSYFPRYTKDNLTKSVIYVSLCLGTNFSPVNFHLTN